MRDRILALLEEISSVCEKENIPFFLSEEFALRVYRGQPIGEKFCDAAIMIFAGDAKRLSRALLEEHKQRVVESLENNKDFPGFYLRYMDPRTTMLYYGDQRYSYKTNAIGIDIELICGIRNDGWKNKILNHLKASQCQRFLADYLDQGNVKSRWWARILLKLFDSEKGRRKLFNAWIKQGSEKRKNLAVALNNGKQIRLDRSIFKATDEKWIDGKCYPMVKDSKALMQRLYANGPKLRPYSEFLYDTSVPWEQYYKDIKARGINLKKAQTDRKDYLRWRKEYYLPLLNKRTYYYDVVFCSGERVKFWRKYGNEKILTIQRLYSEKKCSKLKDELADYLEALKYYGRKKIGFCFNPELLEIGIKLLIMEDAENTRTEKAYKKKYAKWLNIVKKIPYQHFDKIENSFGGTRTKADVLKEKKHLCYNRLQQFCDEYYAGKEKETGSI